MFLKKQLSELKEIRGAMIFEFFSPGIPVILKNAGCQFIIFDMEHGGLSLEQFKILAAISNANGISPLIRIPEINYNYIARALDIGAAGIMAPLYIKKANQNLVNIVQIETKIGLDNVEKIASIDGVDCLWVGHFDLTNFLGIPGDFKSDLYLNAINKIVLAAKSNNKSLGIMVNNKDELDMYKKLGFNMIAVGTEMSILGKGVSEILKG